MDRPPANATGGPAYFPFFLWRFRRRFFLRLCVLIFCRLRFLPEGIAHPFFDVAKLRGPKEMLQRARESIHFPHSCQA